MLFPFCTKYEVVLRIIIVDLKKLTDSRSNINLAGPRWSASLSPDGTDDGAHEKRRNYGVVAIIVLHSAEHHQNGDIALRPCRLFIPSSDARSNLLRRRSSLDYKRLI